VDFTREPIIETIITPKEGCKLVIRSSKSVGQEEFFVDAVELISFGSSLFFRSQERPKPFLVPVADYEVLEVREARMVVKHVGSERSIKIGGGREGAARSSRDREESPRRYPNYQEKGGDALPLKEKVVESHALITPTESAGEGGGGGEGRGEKKRERRRHYRRRRGRDEETSTPEGEAAWPPTTSEEVKMEFDTDEFPAPAHVTIPSQPPLSSLLPPPTTLISESIGDRYKDQPFFRRSSPERQEPSALPSCEEDNFPSSELQRRDREVCYEPKPPAEGNFIPLE